jgi:uncharacterized membrane-anchored protein
MAFRLGNAVSGATFLAMTLGASVAFGQPPQQPAGPNLEMLEGPCEGKLGTRATIKVPKDYSFVQTKDMARLNEITHNLHNPNDMGAVVWYSKNGEQFVVFFNFDPSGYVKDDEKDKLDADQMLAAMRSTEAESNKERSQRGWAPLTLLGWEKAPYFDEQTKRLTWAIRNSSQGAVNINYESRVLGRTGVMSATLVCGPESLAEAVPEYNELLKTFEYNSGEKYSEWRSGDKVAAYGLTALVAGGGLALAAKTGLLAKLIKPIIVGFVVVGGAIASFFRNIFGIRPKES